MSLFSTRSSGFKNIRVSSVNDAHDTNTEVFTTGASKVDVVTVVVIHSGLRQHGVIFYLRLSQGRRVVGKEDHLGYDEVKKQAETRFEENEGTFLLVIEQRRGFIAARSTFR